MDTPRPKQLVNINIDGIDYKIPFHEKMALLRKVEAIEKQSNFDKWDSEIDWDEIMKVMGVKTERGRKGNCPPKDGTPCPNMFRVIPSGQNIECEKCGIILKNGVKY